MQKIRIVNQSGHPLPEYATNHSAGFDLRAHLTEPLKLQPMERKLVKTGLFMEIPPRHEAQIRPRSGLALKSGITVLNAPGTIDADYRGEIGVVLINLSNDTFTINNGDRMAQMVIAGYQKIDFVDVDELQDSKRGAGGFGSTGK